MAVRALAASWSVFGTLGGGVPFISTLYSRREDTWNAGTRNGLDHPKFASQKRSAWHAQSAGPEIAPIWPVSGPLV
eukprot:462968-Prymnesium_polylepis.1